MLVTFLVAFHGVHEPRRQSRQDLMRAKLSFVRIQFVITGVGSFRLFTMYYNVSLIKKNINFQPDPIKILIFIWQGNKYEVDTKSSQLFLARYKVFPIILYKSCNSMR